VRDDVSINSKTLLVTDFVNLKIKSAQSFGDAHRGRVCVRVFIGVSAHMCMSIYVSQKQNPAIVLQRANHVLMMTRVGVDMEKFCRCIILTQRQ
jgi:hypothetical protein